jgi:hypothetical protein
VNVLGLLAAAASLLPRDALPNTISSCVAMILPVSASRGEFDQLTLETFDRFVYASSVTRDPRKRMAIYAPETRCHTDRCNAEQTRQREEAIRAHMVKRGVHADRIRLIDLEQGFSRFGRVPERTALVIVEYPGAAPATCDTTRIHRSD